MTLYNLFLYEHTQPQFHWGEKKYAWDFNGKRLLW